LLLWDKYSGFKGQIIENTVLKLRAMFRSERDLSSAEVIQAGRLQSMLNVSPCSQAPLKAAAEKC